MKQCITKVLPIFNRMVVFNTTETSFHGHPEPLNCPKDRSRKSLALYYYTIGQQEDDFSQTHSTLFRTRPGEKEESKNKIKKKISFGSKIKVTEKKNNFYKFDNSFLYFYLDYFLIF